jgi:AraC family transcriptional regulator of adaptative response/methylated-DNA-[protein]-cysteine methyltransferase
MFTNQDDRWGAIMRRDAAADGAFFFSVQTTGVYCRPSCPSRRARRENVRFHLTCADAEAAGFRPCKRCRPDERPLAQRQSSAIAKVCRVIENADIVPDVATLAQRAGMSRFHFQRVFKSVTGVTPRAYAAAHRAIRVRSELSRTATVTEAIYNAGYNSDGRFYARSTEMLGMTPSEFRSGAPGAAIRFAVGECALGAILVAASAKGICAILLGDDPDALGRDLQHRFPRATLVAGDAAFETWVTQVVGFVDAPRIGLDLPLDIRGTAFQQRVWQALREIPVGATATYAQIARQLGAPRSARAVAQACAANPLAVAIPCHRVVREGGSVSGYRWGVERKRALLDRETRS